MNKILSEERASFIIRNAFSSEITPEFANKQEIKPQE